MAAAGSVIDTKPESRAKDVTGGLEKYLSTLVPKPSRAEPDICLTPSPKVAPFCATRDLAYQTAELTFETSKEQATGVFRTATGAWRIARSTYALTVAQAQAVLNQQVVAAVTAYDNAINDDSRSREWYLYYTMKLAIAQALQTYQGSVAAAADTLAGDLGTLIAASQTYVDGIAAAQSQRFVDDATADQAFWQSVENVLDAVP
jgi:hypothetical protein